MAEWRDTVIHAGSVVLCNMPWELFSSFPTLRSCPPLSKYHSVSVYASGCVHTNTPPTGFSFTRDSAPTKLSVKESPESHAKLEILRSDSLQKPCSRVKDSTLPTCLSSHSMPIQPQRAGVDTSADISSGSSWTHHQDENGGLLPALPTHLSVARSRITISVIHPSDCNLSISPGSCNVPESLECSCVTPVSHSFSDSSSNLHPPWGGCPVSPPPTTRLSALLTPSPCSLALCRPVTPRRTPGSPLGFPPPCPGLHPGVCPHPRLGEALCWSIRRSST